MKLGLVPQNPLEWLALRANLVPVPLAHTQISFVLAQAVLDATELGVFEALADAPQSLPESAARTQLNERALRSLLHVLLAAGYLRYDDARYSLTPMARKWCLRASPDSLADQQAFNEVCWKWMASMKEFLRTGQGLQYHDTFDEREWALYQRGMESVSRRAAQESVRLAPRLRRPTRMLDLGGAHGRYSLAFCQRYPGLQATILDLPPAVAQAEPLLRQHAGTELITYQPGNALTDDLGTDTYDVVLISSLMHHFTAEQNRLVSAKIARALRPGGYLLIQEFLRPEPGPRMEMTAAILDLFFNLSSTSGNYSADELRAFQTGAGLRHRRIRAFLAPPGFAQVVAQKP
jgi:SAM-dependent methyltransferase